jgi:sugar phosphate permease
MPVSPKTEAADFMPSPGILEILKQRSAWGTCAGLFCTNYLSYFLITWLPFYLVHERQFSMTQMAKITGTAYISAAIVGTLCGWLSDRWIAGGRTPTRVRKTFTGTGMACAGVFLLACVASGSTLSILMVVMATVSYGICSSNVWAITQTLAGPQAAGRWTGVQNFMGNLAGVVAPAFTGFVVDRTGEFFWSFVIAAAVSGFGTLCWVFFVGPVRQVAWRAQGRAESVDVL